MVLARASGVVAAAADEGLGGLHGGIGAPAACQAARSPCNREFLPGRIWRRDSRALEGCDCGCAPAPRDRSGRLLRTAGRSGAGAAKSLLSCTAYVARRVTRARLRLRRRGAHHERDRPRDAGGGAERPAAGGERDGPHVRARRLLPGDLRGLRPLRRDLRQGQWRRHRPGRAGPADLRRRDAVHHACGDRPRAGGRRSAPARRHLHHQRSLRGRHPSHGREDGEAVLLSRPPVGVSVEHRALARHRGLGAGGASRHARRRSSRRGCGCRP